MPSLCDRAKKPCCQNLSLNFNIQDFGFILTARKYYQASAVDLLTGFKLRGYTMYFFYTIIDSCYSQNQNLFQRINNIF